MLYYLFNWDCLPRKTLSIICLSKFSKITQQCEKALTMMVPYFNNFFKNPNHHITLFLIVQQCSFPKSKSQIYYVVLSIGASDQRLKGLVGLMRKTLSKWQSNTWKYVLSLTVHTVHSWTQNKIKLYTNLSPHSSFRVFLSFMALLHKLHNSIKNIKHF